MITNFFTCKFFIGLDDRSYHWFINFSFSIILFVKTIIHSLSEAPVLSTVLSRSTPGLVVFIN